jgi:YgiT-type zinc finger domain-containing protein
MRPVTRSFGSGEQLMVIEGVPLLSCRHCGASYFEARTLHEIERLRRDAATKAVVRSVPVARFPGGAG